MAWAAIPHLSTTGFLRTSKLEVWYTAPRFFFIITKPVDRGCETIRHTVRMKKIVFLVCSLTMGLCPCVAEAFETVSIASASAVSPQVCQFSLSSYSGKINSSCSTEYFTVGLSCPQQEDVYATVIVVIDGYTVASKVVQVPAGKTSSDSVNIYVGKDFVGQSYRLVVQ